MCNCIILSLTQPSLEVLSLTTSNNNIMLYSTKFGQRMKRNYENAPAYFMMVETCFLNKLKSFFRLYKWSDQFSNCNMPIQAATELPELDHLVSWVTSICFYKCICEKLNHGHVDILLSIMASATLIYLRKREILVICSTLFHKLLTMDAFSSNSLKDYLL